MVCIACSHQGTSHAMVDGVFDGPCQIVACACDRFRPPVDPVNHPSHYGDGEDDPYEVIKIIEHFKLGFHLGNTFKYMARAGKKDPAKEIEDLEKARWYLDRKIKIMRKA